MSEVLTASSRDVMEFEPNTMCPSYEIAAYIDGELDAVREFEIESHFASCQICLSELNQQKQFLRGLDMSLRQERELELPANFTKVIVANAESTVSGLRRPRERFNAVFICVGLLLFVLFATGADAGKVFAGAESALDKAVVVGTFFGHLFYTFFLGVSIVLRSLAVQFRVDVLLVVVATFLIAALMLVISRKILRMRGI